MCDMGPRGASWGLGAPEVRRSGSMVYGDGCAGRSAVIGGGRGGSGDLAVVGKIAARRASGDRIHASQLGRDAGAE